MFCSSLRLACLHDVAVLRSFAFEFGIVGGKRHRWGGCLAMSVMAAFVYPQRPSIPKRCAGSAIAENIKQTQQNTEEELGVCPSFGRLPNCDDEWGLLLGHIPHGWPMYVCLCLFGIQLLGL